MQKRKNATGRARAEQPETDAATKGSGLWKKVVAGSVVVGGVGAFVGGVVASSNTSFDLWSKVTPADIEARIVKASFQDRQFDLVEIRVSNPSVKGDSLTEPAFECVTADKAVSLRAVWYEPAGESPFPSFPAGTRFPLNVAPTSTLEISVLVYKAMGLQGLRDCRELRFSWIDAHHKRQYGPAVKIQPETAMVVFTS